MKLIHYILIISFVIIVSCKGSNEAGEDFPIDGNTYLNDKQMIRENFINNVEYYRLYHLYDTDSVDYNQHYKSYPLAKSDPANFFVPYGCRMLVGKNKFVNSPYPTKSQLNVIVDTIYYDKSGNLFVAFLSIESKYNNIPSLKDIRHQFDGRAMIGYRDTLNDSLKIYPLSNFMAMGLTKEADAISSIKKDYVNNLKGSYLAGSVFGSNRFNENVGDIDFFQKSQLFEMYDSIHFSFQMYKDLNEIREYKYFFGN